MQMKLLGKKPGSPSKLQQAEAGMQRDKEENLYTASQWTLMWMRFKKNKFAVVSLVCIILLYIGAIIAPFISPYTADVKFSEYKFAAPTKIYFSDPEGNFSLTPTIYKMKASMNSETFARDYVEDRKQFARVKMFVKGESYKLLGLFETDIHLFGTDNTKIPIFVFGTDSLGRDLFSRIFYGSQVSLSIGIVGNLISFVLGILIGGIAAYYGKVVDNLIMRFIEIIQCIPTLPLWMGLSAAIPAVWPPLQVYFGITVILSFLGWTGLARVVRGKFMSMRDMDFITAARLAGRSKVQIIFKHMLPSFASYIIISLTGTIPGMIMGETGLSFLGLGIKPPIVSWGVLLQEARNLNTLAIRPWLFIPSLFLVFTVLIFNFLGDGLREAADPYSTIN